MSVIERFVEMLSTLTTTQKSKFSSYLLLATVGCTTALASRYLVVKLSRFFKGLPVNGPVGMPFIGCLYHLYFGDYGSFAKNWGQHTCNAGKKLFTMRMGQTDVVVINDLQLAKQVYCNRSTTIGITRPFYHGLWYGNNVQNFLAGNKYWRQRKKLVMQFLVNQHKSQHVTDIFNENFSSILLNKYDLHENRNKIGNGNGNNSNINSNRNCMIWSTISNDIRYVLLLSTLKCVFGENLDMDANTSQFKQFADSVLFIDHVLGYYFTLNANYFNFHYGQLIKYLLFRNPLNQLTLANEKYHEYILPFLVKQFKKAKAESESGSDFVSKSTFVGICYICKGIVLIKKWIIVHLNTMKII